MGSSAASSIVPLLSSSYPIRCSRLPGQFRAVPWCRTGERGTPELLPPLADEGATDGPADGEVEGPDDLLAWVPDHRSPSGRDGGPATSIPLRTHKDVHDGDIIALISAVFMPASSMGHGSSIIGCPMARGPSFRSPRHVLRPSVRPPGLSLCTRSRWTGGLPSQRGGSLPGWK